MTTKELVEMLSKLDPEGNLEIQVYDRHEVPVTISKVSKERDPQKCLETNDLVIILSSVE